MSEHGNGRPPEMPTPQELMERKKRELSDWIEKNQDFLPHHIADQLTDMLNRFQFIPKNVMSFLDKGFDVFRTAKYPSELLQLDSTELPTHNDADKSFSPICIIATTIPGVSLFPMRSLQATQRSTAGQHMKGMDPITRRELARQGMLQINTGLGNAKDAKRFYGFPFANDVIDITEIMARISNSQIKRKIFERIAATRLNRMANRLDDGVKKRVMPVEKEKVFSRTGRDLRETARPENINFLLDEVGKIAQPWLAGQAESAEIIPLKKDEKLIETLQQDPFWFAYASDEEVSAQCQQLEKELREFIQDYLTWAPTGSVSGLRQELAGSPTSQDFLQAYIGKDFEEILNEEMQPLIKEQITEAKKVTHDLLFGKTGYAQDVISFVDEFTQDLEKILSEKQTNTKDDKTKKSKKITGSALDETDTDAETIVAMAEQENKPEVLDFSTYKKKREESKNKPKEKNDDRDGKEQTPIYLIARLIELNRMLTKSLPKTEMAPMFMIFYQLGTRYIQEFFKLENRADIQMSDLYSSSNRSKLKKLHRLFGQFSDEEEATRSITYLVAQELEKLSDTDLINLYAQLHTDSGAGPINNIVLSDTYTPQGSNGLTYPNRFPATRQRLLQLYREKPNLFNNASKLAQTIGNYLKKTT